MLPREKLGELGAERLTTQELLAVVLGRGTKKESVFSLSRRILSEYGNKGMLKSWKPEEVQTRFGIGPVTALQLCATFELGRRLFGASVENHVLDEPTKVAEYLEEMKSLSKEHFRGLYLNSRFQLIYDEVISIGSLDQSVVHPREVFRPALVHRAFGIILAHNHPSGDTSPSRADIETTAQLEAAGAVFQIPVIDHMVIGKKGFLSLREAGLMQHVEGFDSA